MWKPAGRFVGERFLIFSCRFHNGSTQPLSDSISPVKSKTMEKHFCLPPYSAAMDAPSIAKMISGKSSSSAADESTTAFKWILHCRPDLPRALLQKLFRLRKIRRMTASENASSPEGRGKRVSLKDSLNYGDIILLPTSVRRLPPQKTDSPHIYTEEERKFIQSLVFHKDSAILAINKPPGLPVQGGSGVRISLDKIAAACLKYDLPDPPRLVHRLDRDSSGILIMGRTQKSAAFLHSIFREETSSAVGSAIFPTHLTGKTRAVQKTYIALVLGSPRRSSGIVNVPLWKVVVDGGKSERITVIAKEQNGAYQQAMTRYRVLQCCEGLTWMELTPLTGRKHQLRVHCAEILGTPIVGDYKYGRRRHKTFEFGENLERKSGKALSLEKGSILDEQPLLHLHCANIILPDFSLSSEEIRSLCGDYDLPSLKTVSLEAPLTSYMQQSWNLTHGC